MKRVNSEYLRAHVALHSQNKHQQYELRKQLWMEEHPEASPEDYTRAVRAIA